MRKQQQQSAEWIRHERLCAKDRAIGQQCVCVYKERDFEEYWIASESSFKCTHLCRSLYTQTLFSRQLAKTVKEKCRQCTMRIRTNFEVCKWVLELFQPYTCKSLAHIKIAHNTIFFEIRRKWNRMMILVRCPEKVKKAHKCLQIPHKKW